VATSGPRPTLLTLTERLARSRARSRARTGARAGARAGPPPAAPAAPPATVATAPGSAGASWRPSLVERGGRVVAWDPCVPIPYLLLRPGMPEGGPEAIASVLAEVHGISGYRFVPAGWTDRAPRSVSELNGHVLLGWVEPGQVPAFETGEVDSAGTGGLAAVGGRPIGGFAVVRRPSHGRPVVDAVALDVLRHEVGHLLGLGHVDDPRQLMHPTHRRGNRGFADGDVAGLRALAQLGCRHRAGVRSAG
jgi:hypothetical protein